MKIPFNKRAAIAQAAAITPGRHIGTVIQIASLGDQPAFNVGEPPVPSIGVVIQLAAGLVSKKIKVSDSPFSVLFGFLDASLPDPDTFDGDNALPSTLGRPVAVEVVVRGQFANVDSFHRPESFELAQAPTVSDEDLLLLEDPDSLAGDAGRAVFPRLHRDIRGWISRRVRS